MNINLKQNEIESALKDYIIHQGINLTGKKVFIDFTAGRKASGITAEVTIEDTGLGQAVVGSNAVGNSDIFPTAAIMQLSPVIAQAIQEEEATQELEPEPEVVPVVKTSSLFG